jgi:hypothetical protein
MLPKLAEKHNNLFKDNTRHSKHEKQQWQQVLIE